MLSSAVLESVVLSSSVVETTEEVLVVEVSLVELLLLPLQAAMLRASIRTITEAMIFFIFSFPFDDRKFAPDTLPTWKVTFRCPKTFAPDV